MKKNKIISLCILSLAVLTIIFYGCKPKIEPLKASAKFTLNPAVPHVGEPFTITMEQANEFSTVFLGDTTIKDKEPLSRVYEDYPHCSGYVINGTSAVFNTDTTMYLHPGTFTITVVARNYGQWSEEYDEDIQTLEITVTDQRAAFTKFGFAFTDAFYGTGSIIKDSAILVRVPEQRDISNVIPEFTTSTSGAKVYVGTDLQTSGSNSHDFSSPVTYKIVAEDGTEKEYIVTTQSYLADTSTSFSMDLIVPMEQVVTVVGDTVEVNIPWGSVLTAMPVSWTIPNYSPGLYIDGVYQGEDYVPASTGVAIFSVGSTFKVEAESGDTALYHTKVSYRSPVLSFGFPDLNPPVTGVISDTTITCDFYLDPADTTFLTSLTPTFSEGDGKSSVKIGAIDIKDSNKAVDFTAAADSFQVMTVKGVDGISVDYRIVINRN